MKFLCWVIVGRGSRRIWLEAGARRRLPSTTHGNAVVGVLGEWCSDIFYDTDNLGLVLSTYETIVCLKLD